MLIQLICEPLSNKARQMAISSFVIVKMQTFGILGFSDWSFFDRRLGKHIETFIGDAIIRFVLFRATNSRWKNISHSSNQMKVISNF